MHALAHKLAHHPWIAFLLLIALTAGLVWSSIGLQPHYEMEDFFPRETPERERFEAMRDHFGRDDRTALLVFVSDAPLEAEFYSALRELMTTLEARDDLESVSGPNNVLLMMRDEGDIPRLEEALPEGFDATLLESRLARLDEPPFTRLFVSPDRQLVLLRATLHEDRVTNDDRQALYADLRALEPHFEAQTGVDMRLGGYPLQRVMIIETIRDDFSSLLPIVLGVTLLLLTLALRGLMGTLAALSVVILSMLWTTGWMALLGLPPNIMAPGVYVLVMVVGVSDAVHLWTRLNEHHNAHPETPRESLREALNELLGPCALTSLTTAVSFTALALSDIPLIAHFGLQVALGVLSAYVVTMLAVPALATVAFWVRAKALPLRIVQKAPTLPTLITPWLARLDDQVQRHPRRALAVCGVLALIAALGVPQMTLNSPLLADLEDHHPVRQTNALLEQHAAGIVSVDLLVDPPEGDRNAAFSTDHMTRIAALTDALRELDGVITVTSPIDILRQMTTHLQRDGEDKDPASMMPTALLLAEDQLPVWLNEDTRAMRLRLTLENLDTPDALALFAEIEARYVDVMDQPLDGRLTGQGYLGQIVNTQMVDHFQWSFFAALGAVFLLLLTALRDIPRALLALLPQPLSHPPHQRPDGLRGH